MLTTSGTGAESRVCTGQSKGSVVQPCVRESVLFPVLKRDKKEVGKRNARRQQQQKNKLKNKCLHCASHRYFQEVRLRGLLKAKSDIVKEMFPFASWNVERFCACDVAQSKSLERRLLFFPFLLLFWRRQFSQQVFICGHGGGQMIKDVSGAFLALSV